MTMKLLTMLCLSFLTLGVTSVYADEAAPSNEHSESSNKLGLFVEPGISYEFSNSTINYPAPFNDHDGNVHGFGLLGRLGFHVADVIFIAADGRYSRPTFRDSTGNFDSTADAYNWGVTGGIQTPVAGLRLWASWILGAGIDPDSVNNFDVKYSSGSGWRVGAGFYIEALSLNFEYQHIGYDTVEVQQIGAFTPGTSFSGSELRNNSYIFSVSFPVAL